MHLPWSGAFLPAGSVVIPRPPLPFEDWVGGAWVVTNPKGLADWKAGPTHIVEARALKYLEALLIASGVPLLKGLLVDEAQVKGTTALQLANQVITKRTAFIAAEVTRQRRQGGATD